MATAAKEFERDHQPVLSLPPSVISLFLSLAWRRIWRHPIRGVVHVPRLRLQAAPTRGRIAAPRFREWAALQALIAEWIPLAHYQVIAGSRQLGHLAEDRGRKCQTQRVGNIG